MALSDDLISQFVKVTQDEKQTKKESTAYGKIIKQGDVEYVKLDGSDLLTPISSTTVVNDGDRVMVTIKNHEAIVTGDFTNPSASDKDVKEINGKISEFEIIIADKISVQQLEAEVARIDKVIADNVEATNAKFETIEGKVADIDTIKADVVEVEKKITAHEGEFTTIRGEIAEFEDVTAERVDAIDGSFHNLESDYATFKQTTTNKITANEGAIAELDTKKLDAESATITYANIDFSNIKEAAIEKLFSDSGIIKDLIMKDGNVTGELVGVTIKGDLIEGNTVKADKLVILGEDGIYYKLNVDALGEATASSDEKYQNGLDGSVIIAKSITATKIAVTDLVAFGATIGGYHITDHTLYSGVKSSATNTTRGVFLGDDGQMAVGDANNYLRFFKDSNGNYKLEIQASALKLGASSKSVEEVITDTVNNAVDNIQVGGRNYVLNSANIISNKLNSTAGSRAEYHAINVGQSYMTIPNGTTVTISFDLEMTVNTANPTLAVYNSNNKGPKGLYYTTLNFTAAVGETIKKRCYVQNTITDRSDADKTDNYIEFYSTYDTSNWFSISKLKVEIGNKATDWTPAPEDTDTKINSVETKADSAQSTANKAQTAANSAQTSANNAQTAASNAQTSANNAQTTATNAQNAVNNLKIGARNLLLNSSFKEDTDKWTGTAEIVDLNGKKCAHIKHTALKTNKIVYQSVLDKIEPNTTYTMSGWVRTDNIVKGTTNFTCMFYQDGYYDKDGASTWYGYGSKNFTINTGVGSWEYITWTFTTDDKIKTSTSCKVMVHTRDFTGDVYFYNLKFEKGNKATDWTPAPEDVQANIDGVQTNVDNIQIGGRNMLTNTDFKVKKTVTAWDTEKNGTNDAQGWNGHNSGVTNPTTCYHAHLTELDGEWVYEFIRDTETWIGTVTSLLSDPKPGEEYTFSCEIRRPAGSKNFIDGGPYYSTEVNTTNGFHSNRFSFQNTLDDTWEKFSHVFTMKPDKLTTDVRFYVYGHNGVGTVYMRKPKFELGNKATDWTLAPEDIDTDISNVQIAADAAQTDANTAKDLADAAKTDASDAKASIDVLQRMIATLVTDADGGSLMTQTPDGGWTFSMSSITGNLEAIQKAMETMNTDHSETNNALQKLTSLINDVADKTAYIVMATDEKGNPCIELGKTTDDPDTNDFKVRITNEAINFMEGSMVIAYANNNTFYAEKMIVKNELQIGEGPGFVWRTRSNGNMGLVYISG